MARITSSTRTFAMRGAAIIVLLTLNGCEPSSKVGKTTEAAERRVQSERARAMFEERCKHAGETIHRTVDNVDGIYLLKLRPLQPNFSDQYALNDPYGRDLGGDGYIATFLREFDEAQAINYPTEATLPQSGYQFVEAADPVDGLRERYTGRIQYLSNSNTGKVKTFVRFATDKKFAFGPLPRYGVTYEDISTSEERAHWIAGSALKVIDMRTNTVIAQRIGYMFDPAQGNTSGERSPWLLAANHACPAFSQPHGALTQFGQTKRFVEKVLKPKLGVTK